MHVHHIFAECLQDIGCIFNLLFGIMFATYSLNIRRLLTQSIHGRPNLHVKKLNFAEQSLFAKIVRGSAFFSVRDYTRWNLIYTKAVQNVIFHDSNMRGSRKFCQRGSNFGFFFSSFFFKLTREERIQVPL